MSIRRAKRSDIPAIVDILTKAFWNEDAVGQFMHPHRDVYPDDVKKYWRRNLRSVWWEKNHWQLVVVSDEGTIVGFAGWALVDGEFQANTAVLILWLFCHFGNTRRTSRTLKLIIDANILLAFLRSEVAKRLSTSISIPKTKIPQSTKEN